MVEHTKEPLWYHGGIASTMGGIITHPIDLIRVNVQTAQVKIPVHRMITNIYATKGLFGFYYGMSATISRQLSYSIPRFAVYHVGKEYVNTDTFFAKMKLATLAGIFGGSLSAPFDLISIRMLYDVMLNTEAKWKYRNTIDGIIKNYKKGGFRMLFTGITINTLRAITLNIGQMAVYDHISDHIVKTRTTYCEKMNIYVVSSAIAGTCATVITHPLEVFRIRQMSAEDYPTLIEIIRRRYQMGWRYFFTGIFYTHCRLVPQTFLTFVFLDELRSRYGKPLPSHKKSEFYVK